MNDVESSIKGKFFDDQIEFSECVWVPAAVCKILNIDESNSNRRIYGGVHLTPKLESVDKNSSSSKYASIFPILATATHSNVSHVGG